MSTQYQIDVKNLSDRRLWELLRVREHRDPRLSAADVERVRRELLLRDQLIASRRYHAPH